MLVRAKAGFVVALKNGANVSVGAGTVWDSTDQVVKGREDLFEPVDTWASRVERTTAAPGEKRVVTKPAVKKPSVKKAKPTGGNEK